MENDELMARFDIENRQNSGYLFARESWSFDHPPLFEGETIQFKDTLDGTPKDEKAKGAADLNGNTFQGSRKQLNEEVAHNNSPRSLLSHQIFDNLSEQLANSENSGKLRRPRHRIHQTVIITFWFKT